MSMEEVKEAFLSKFQFPLGKMMADRLDYSFWQDMMGDIDIASFRDWDSTREGGLFWNDVWMWHKKEQSDDELQAIFKKHKVRYPGDVTPSKKAMKDFRSVTRGKFII